VTWWLALAAWAMPSTEVQQAARDRLASAAPLPDALPHPDTARGQAVWHRALQHPQWYEAPLRARLVWRDSEGPSSASVVELDLQSEADRLVAVYLCLAAEPPRDCDLRTVVPPDEVLQLAHAPTEVPVLDKHFRYIDPTSCCPPPEPTPPTAPCDLDEMLQALIAVEAALRAGAAAEDEGRALIAATECQANVPRPIAARVLRAIGATRPPEERAQWWSAAWELTPVYAYGAAEVSAELREAADELQPVPWRHLPLARRIVDEARAPRTPRHETYDGVRHLIFAYAPFPSPRVWGVAGISQQGPAHGIGASVGAGSTAVVFGERSGGATFFGVGSHSFIGDAYHHTDGVLVCRETHPHYVRPGLLVGAVYDDGAWGMRARPEVSIGATANLLVAVPVTWLPEQGWSVGLQGGVALGLP